MHYGEPYHLPYRLRGQNTFIRDIILLQRSSKAGAAYNGEYYNALVNLEIVALYTTGEGIGPLLHYCSKTLTIISPSM